jgi:hypothetical protein
MLTRPPFGRSSESWGCDDDGTRRGRVMERIRCIAWDFDGVLNRNVIHGRFVW